ncbi:T2EA [Hepatospora eriocheir]|uniref:T2EA n=1 Tax=Hepatospora eriocheir TaxID=1081669 RepID=A0A1X0QL03_9MICR|nr:T2EA [Hepatospora eriocheir]
MEEEDYYPKMKELIKMVTSTFYEPRHIVIVDILLEEMVMSESEICSKMHFLSREFNRMLQRLKDDKIIRCDSKIEIQGDGRQFIKTYYYIDFAEVRDIIKYKIYKMSKLLESQNIEGEDKFVCKGCNKIYTALDAQLCMEKTEFICYYCKEELEEYKLTEDKYNIDHKQLMDNLEPVINLLKKVSHYSIPPVNMFDLEKIKTKKQPEKIVVKETPKEEKKESEFIQNTEDSVESKKKENSVKNDILLSVNGIPKFYSEITQEDHDKMTAEEYTAFYEAFTQNS